MKTQKLFKYLGACALATGALGISAASSSAAPGQTGSAYGFTLDLGGLNQFQTPAGLAPGVDIVGSCPQWLYGDDPQLGFLAGNQVVSRDGLNQNDEGPAQVFDGTTGGSSAVYTGKGHAWFGANFSKNKPSGEMPAWDAQTAMFHGIDQWGDILDISFSAGGGISAGNGSPTGWLHVKVTCTPAS